MDAGSMLDDRYRLLDRLGAGGMSVIWRAHDEVLGRDVAVKLLSPELAADPQLLHRIRAEARSAARLRHPNVVEVYDYGEAANGDGPPVPYVVMEVVEGRSLAQLLSGGPLPWRVAALVCAQVAAALAAAHRRGIVHRDVKPGNVMVAGAGVKLVDFGISAASGDPDGLSEGLLGTPAYLAPERLERGLVQPSTDVYALGLLLYRALAGRLPWQASTTTQMLAAHRYREPATLPDLAGLPAAVGDLCRRCLAKDPAERPPAAEAASVLGTAAGVPPTTLLLPGSADGTEPMPTRLWSPSLAPVAAGLAASPLVAVPVAGWRRLSPPRRVAVAGAVAVTLLAGSAAALLSARGSPEEHPRAQAGPPAAVMGIGQRQPECSVRYALDRVADGRSSSRVTVTNTGTVPIGGARLAFSLPDRQRLVQGSPGTWRQSGASVQASIGDLPPRGTVTATLAVTYREATSLPGQFRVNDTPCRSSFAVAGQTSQPAPRSGKDDGGKGKGGKKGNGRKDAD
ncbi:protein kinase [Micromonospora terminaliae]|uniref:non-specific serine/threonine protein kinase n=1 Tax=Micromonospora terminaliae TaxID=1914461 RepID=A0ABX6DX26_9ACTN|nr:serine/threonine-protein kinase [Micromonospora terminaliae]QGL46135.1 protein kinase [Micromonospora terminaliae]